MVCRPGWRISRWENAEQGAVKNANEDRPALSGETDASNADKEISWTAPRSCESGAPCESRHMNGLDAFPKGDTKVKGGYGDSRVLRSYHPHMPRGEFQDVPATGCVPRTPCRSKQDPSSGDGGPKKIDKRSAQSMIEVRSPGGNFSCTSMSSPPDGSDPNSAIPGKWIQ